MRKINNPFEHFTQHAVSALFDLYKLACLALLLFVLPSVALAQTKEVLDLTADESLQTVNFPGFKYYEGTIPANPAGISVRNLYLSVEGADGGAFLRTMGKSDTDGGEGATVSATFTVGNGDRQIPPGSTIRFIIGEKGAQKPRDFGGSIGMGGGGGTGIVFRKPSGDADQEWHILLAAGGGGGAYGDCCAIQSPGLPASAGVNGVDGRGCKGGTISDCLAGTDGESFNHYTKDMPHGGGGIKQHLNDDGSLDPNWSHIAFQNGDPTGGRYQKTDGGGKDVYGGFGFGGGGTGYGFGGGGGGYSGGGSGVEFSGGGGGGSYVNVDYAQAGLIVKKQNGTTNNPRNGWVQYQFTDYSSACRSIAFNYGIQQEETLLQTGPFSLKWQTNGVLVLVQGATVLWESNTYGKGATSLSFQGDGNLVIYSQSQAIWAAGTVGAKRMVLQPTGNLFIANADGTQRWATNTTKKIFSVSRPRTFEYKDITQNVDVLKAGNYKLVWQTNGNLVLWERYGWNDIPCWSSNTAGKGANFLAFYGDGNMVIRNTNTKQTLWATWTQAATNNGKGGMKLLLTENGRAMINDEANHTMWSTPTYGFDKPVHIRYAANPNRALHLAAGSDGTGTNIIIEEELDLDQQYWMFDQQVIRLVSDPTQVLTVENGNLKIDRFLRGANQIFMFNEMDQTIRLVEDHNSCIDLNGNNSTPGTNVQIWPCNGGSAQKWVMY